MGNIERARATMVDTQLRPTGVTDKRIIAIMGSLPREKFVPEERQSIAYVDVHHELVPGGRCLASAVDFARLLQAADIKSTDVVLDVGCGTGYSTAAIASLASAVVGLDDNSELAEKANNILAGLDIGNAAVLAGNIDEGVPSEAPFDVVLIEGALSEIPKALFTQLRVGGRLVAMIGEGATATAHVFVKGAQDVSERTVFSAALPLLTGKSQNLEFSL